MTGLLREFLKKNMKCKINLEIDDRKGKLITNMEGNIPSILTGLSIIVSKLKDEKVPEELIRGAIDIGLKNNKTEKKTKIIEKEIIIDDEVKARKIEKLLEELGVK